jgi:hypothetical protein
MVDRAMRIVSRTFHLCLVLLWMTHEQCSSFSVQRIVGVGVAQKLWKEGFEDILHSFSSQGGLTAPVVLHEKVCSLNIGDHVWLITSRHTEPLLMNNESLIGDDPEMKAYSSSMLGWNILFINPILGDLYGY